MPLPAAREPIFLPGFITTSCTPTQTWGLLCNTATAHYKHLKPFRKKYFVQVDSCNSIMWVTDFGQYLVYLWMTPTEDYVNLPVHEYLFSNYIPHVAQHSMLSPLKILFYALHICVTSQFSAQQHTCMKTEEASTSCYHAKPPQSMKTPQEHHQMDI